MNFDVGIIDLDPLIYRCGFSVEKWNKELDILVVEPLNHAIYNINSMFRKIQNVTNCELYYGYLTSNDKSNFRFEVFPEYKANRKNARKPVYYTQLRDYLVNFYQAEIVKNIEADDACSIKQYELNSLGFFKESTNSIVCSFDKDFNNIPGWHYNYIKEEVYYVDEKEALKNFYLQILTGDVSDGIPRIKKGWKSKTAEVKIKKANNEEEMIDIVRKEMYNIYYADSAKQNLTKNEINEYINKEIKWRGQLVWLQSKPNEMWQIPSFQK